VRKQLLEIASNNKAFLRELKKALFYNAVKVVIRSLKLEIHHYF
jgi:hypothetical protein